MVPIISLFIVIILSISITKIAAIALVHTGLSKESARFQARSAFSGVGFTTGEAESVVNHPVRRRIVLLLMLLGNAGIVTAVTSLILTFLPHEDLKTLGLKLLFLLIGISIILISVQSRWLDQYLFKIVSRALKRYTNLDVKDYASLLHISSEYRVTELVVEPQDWIANRSLKDLKLATEGILVLGISRHGHGYIGSPKADTVIYPDDKLILYGRESRLKSLDQRKKGAKGDREHEKAAQEQLKMRNLEEKD